MIDGQMVFNADNHVHASVEVLEPYFEAEFH